MQKFIASLAAIAFFTSCGNTPDSQALEPVNVENTSGAHTFKAEVWGDNWFAFYLG